MSKHCLVAVRFKTDVTETGDELERGEQDISNALDLADFPAEVDDIKSLVQAAVGFLDRVYDRDRNVAAKAIADSLRKYTKDESDNDT